MSELRQDPTTGEWVIVAPARAHRPHDGPHSTPHGAPSNRPRGDTGGIEEPAYDPTCPFCPGNEAQLTEIIHETPAPGEPGWRARVVRNKFPAVDPDAAPVTPHNAIEAVWDGYGHHEVLIKTPRHRADLASRPDDEVASIIDAYRQRYRALLQDPRVRSVFVFRNHGRDAGASLAHPHSQIIALGMTPARLSAREDRARRHFAEAGRCLLCDMAEAEHRDGIRLVGEHSGFLAFVPFAAAHPFETWILPERHQASFAEIRDDEMAALAAILRAVLIRLKGALDDPPYNFMIESGDGNTQGAPHLHWWLRIVPNLVTPGGFELSSGLAINPGLPEEDAEILRQADPG
jgi:UDPglucose--hexose-1-phosphate uridylyltransferase